MADLRFQELIARLDKDPEAFQLTNLILEKKHLKALYMIEDLRNYLIQFARNPTQGMSKLTPPPQPPVEGEFSEVDLLAYEEAMKTYNAMKEAASLYVSPHDYALIEDFLKKFWHTLYAISAVKGQRFFALTKPIPTIGEESAFLHFLRNQDMDEE